MRDNSSLANCKPVTVPVVCHASRFLGTNGCLDYLIVVDCVQRLLLASTSDCHLFHIPHNIDSKFLPSSRRS